MSAGRSTPGPRPLGVEEELLLVDPDDGEVTAVAQQALHADVGPGEAAEVEQELFQQQIETASRPTPDPDELVAGIREGRRQAVVAAAAAGARAVAMPVPLLAGARERLTPEDRYQQIHERYGQMARQALTCGLHVHVEVGESEGGDEARVAVVDRVRPWLPVLLALSANSPYWRGEDTRHESWRSQIWSRWPSAGPAEPYVDLAGYQRAAESLVGWEASLDRQALYFDVRLAQSYPTVELRVADVCTDVADTLLVALLMRALVDTELAAWQAGEPLLPWRTDLLKAAGWRSAYAGVAGPLVHPLSGELASTDAVLGALRDHVGGSLEVAGDAERVRHLLERLVAAGDGAARQRSVLQRTGDLAAVVRDLADRTEESTERPVSE